ncbi:MAG TPA: response regulator transcription factor [Tepidisphaeraceae bacterium]|nr:response regulator transcription factor [Tepidisphaeraceae bacterium]
MPTRVLLVDDHKIMRQGLKSLLEREGDIQVVGEAEDGRTALAMVESLNPDVVLMDISMPGLNGIDATRRTLEAAPRAKVLALTAHSDRTMVREMLRAGAVGFVVKDTAVDELVRAVRTAITGRVYLSPRVAGTVVEGFVKEPHAAAPDGFGGGGDFATGRGGAAAATALLHEPPGVFARLTAREREVLQLMAEGKATKEVARALSVSVKTAETHRRAIMGKLDMHSVAELTKYAVREGLTTLD